jgi:hypothetical protein
MVDMMYVRQEGLSVAPPKTVSVVGCGGIGTWVAIDLAMSGTKRLNLFDDDQLEMHNINRIPFTPNDVGRTKTEILAEFVLKMRPDIQVYQYGKVTELTQNLIEGYVVDCTDKVKTQTFLQGLCTKKKLPYFRIGYDGNHMTIIDGRYPDAPKAADVWDDGSGHEGYTTVPSWVVPPQIGAALLTYIVCNADQRAYTPINVDVEHLTSVNILMEELDKQKKVEDTHGKKPRKSSRR